ncbi:hypothetical protein CTEN210_08636 [Chaetoceros tenuissimus]|uniref:ER membrane protein complex subunit 1 n=1 Tax=Chaetoceros tenuissimus TaxID=426638 RepID=A0AAD3H6G2_9STRA|nr:hypothetical protein CTEN210_08636 [Chaetoceros tenuissimus]
MRVQLLSLHLFLSVHLGFVYAERPVTRPCVAYLTSPFDQNANVKSVSEEKCQTLDISPKSMEECPNNADFHVEIFKPIYEQSDMAIVSQPSIIQQDSVDKLSLLMLRHGEILDYMHIHKSDTKYHMSRDGFFPLLFQGSTFVNTSPVIVDFENDGNEKAVVVDYDGLISLADLHHEQNHEGETTRHSTIEHHYQLPRLQVHKEWVGYRVESLDSEDRDQYDMDAFDSEFIQSRSVSSKKLAQGSSADLLHQNVDVMNSKPTEIKKDRMLKDAPKSLDNENQSQEFDLDKADAFIKEHNAKYFIHDDGEEYEDSRADIDTDDMMNPSYDDHMYRHYAYDDDFYKNERDTEDEEGSKRKFYKGFYNEGNFIEIPPHVVSSPTYFETNDKHYLAVAVSYYFDEDEAMGVRTSHSHFSENMAASTSEAERGLFVASGLSIINLQQTYDYEHVHLDLSTDSSSPLPPKERFIMKDSNNTHLLNFVDGNSYDEMAAYATSSPVITDLDKDGEKEALVTTSLGFIHCHSIPYGRHRFTVQMNNAIHHSVLVQDVVGDEKLEILAIDVKGRLLCIDYDGEILWYVSLSNNPETVLTSDITLGNRLKSQTVVVVTIQEVDHIRVFTTDAKSGSLVNDPTRIPFRKPMKQLPNPIIVTSESTEYIVQAFQNKLYLVNVSTGCQSTLFEEKEEEEITSIQIKTMLSANQDKTILIGSFISGKTFLVDMSVLELSLPTPEIKVHAKKTTEPKDTDVLIHMMFWPSIIISLFLLLFLAKHPSAGGKYSRNIYNNY